MVNEEQQEKAALYALDLLEGEERAAFEARLATDEALREEVRLFRDAAAKAGAGLAGSVTPPPRAWEGISRRLWDDDSRNLAVPQVLLTATSDAGEADSSVREEQRSAAFHRWAWPAAAIILLGLNIFQAMEPETDVEASAASEVAISEPWPGAPPALAEATRVELLSEVRRLRETNATLASEVEAQDATLTVRSDALDRLKEEGALASAEKEELLSEYRRLAARMMPFFDSSGGLSRFTVIELVDSETYASNGPRRGFTQVADDLLRNLADQNIAAVGPGSNRVNFSAYQGGGGAVPMGESFSIQPGRVTDAVAGDPVPGGQLPSDIPATPGAAQVPSAFTVWRDDDQKGFLDIYNLPSAPSGHDYQLWVRASELEAYIPVGNLPDDADGFLSLFYEVDEPEFSPTEVIVTLEAEGGSEAPVGPVILRGP